MSEQVIGTGQGGWRKWGAPAFAAIWGALGGIFFPTPAQGFMEEAAAYSGKLFGQGLFFGLLAAGVAHLLVLRGTGARKWPTYVIGALAGGIASLVAHG